MSVDWDQAYREGNTPWDKGTAAPPLRQFLQSHAVAGKVFIPGCGAGHDVRLLSSYGAEVCGIDLSRTAITQAQSFSRTGNEQYEVMDLFQMPPRYLGAFDWFVEHTCLCAIPPGMRQQYEQALYASLKPGGYFLAVFFREVSDYTGDGPPHPISTHESEALFGERFQLLESFVPTQSYDSRPLGSEAVCWYQRR